MILFFSSDGNRANPEILLRNEACVMLSFVDCNRHSKGITRRLRKMYGKRKKAKGKKHASK